MPLLSETTEQHTTERHRKDGMSFRGCGRGAGGVGGAGGSDAPLRSGLQRRPPEQIVQIIIITDRLRRESPRLRLFAICALARCAGSIHKHAAVRGRE